MVLPPPVGGSIDLAGWLSKLGPGVVEGWKKRYFVLREDRKLFYYASDKEIGGTPKGVIELNDVQTVREGGDKSAKYFMIVTPARTFSLKADSESEMQRWVAGLLEALRRMGKEPMQASPRSSMSPSPSPRRDVPAPISVSSSAPSPGGAWAPGNNNRNSRNISPNSASAAANGNLPPPVLPPGQPAGQSWGGPNAKRSSVTIPAEAQEKLKQAEEEALKLRKTVDSQKLEMEALRQKLAISQATQTGGGYAGCCTTM
jgi:hypothetical protein